MRQTVPKPSQLPCESTFSKFDASAKACARIEPGVKQVCHNVDTLIEQSGHTPSLSAAKSLVVSDKYQSSGVEERASAGLDARSLGIVELPFLLQELLRLVLRHRKIVKKIVSAIDRRRAGHLAAIACHVLE